MQVCEVCGDNVNVVERTIGEFNAAPGLPLISCPPCWREIMGHVSDAVKILEQETTVFRAVQGASQNDEGLTLACDNVQDAARALGHRVQLAVRKARVNRVTSPSSPPVGVGSGAQTVAGNETAPGGHTTIEPVALDHDPDDFVPRRNKSGKFMVPKENVVAYRLSKLSQYISDNPQVPVNLRMTYDVLRRISGRRIVKRSFITELNKAAENHGACFTTNEQENVANFLYMGRQSQVPRRVTMEHINALFVHGGGDDSSSATDTCATRHPPDEPKYRGV